MASMSPHVAEIANLVGDLARANILLALMDHRALTAGELAHVARVSPQTTSSHLVKLTNAKLVQVTQQGRHRYYRLASPLVAQMLETVMVVAGDRISNLKPLSKASEDLRAARSCYDHLAGRLGVAFADALMARGFVILEPEGAQLTPCGMDFLDKLGLEIRALPRARRIFCRPCLDWSERRYHLAGRVGALFLGFCLDRQWLERRSDSRALRVTRLGAQQFAEIFQIEHPPSVMV
ncbi:MAG TPA: winged helix-turn-helix domain-containing protein [Phototrophicaceae bacterium]|jgi:DNA-binding transcriptional ArsR family regulator|nr:winged helix-turn-helix domain-containing protein [Phototrophicaceae bacterium]